MKILLTLFLLILAFQISFGQEKPKAEKIDEFGRLDCCYPNFDAFYNNLLENNSTGYVVIFRNRNNPIETYGYEVAVKTLFLMRKADNVFFVHGKSEEKTRTELWKVPSGAEKPAFDEENWDYTLPDNTKPFIFWHDSEIDEICSFSNGMYIQNILSGNKKANINVVIYAKSQKQFRRKQKEMLKNFFDENNVSRNRIRFFIQPKNDFRNVEFWLIPKKKQN